MDPIPVRSRRLASHSPENTIKLGQRLEPGLKRRLRRCAGFAGHFAQLHLQPRRCNCRLHPRQTFAHPLLLSRIKPRHGPGFKPD